MASPAGRGAQVRLDGDAQAAARGALGQTLIATQEVKRVLEYTGAVADGSTRDGSTRTGAAADDEVLTPGGTAAAADYTAAGTGAVARSVSSKLGDAVSALDFGVTPDFNDNTAHFQAAINWCAANRKVLYVPGRATFYKVSNLTLPSYTTIIGDGPDSSVFFQASNATGPLMSLADTSVVSTNLSNFGINGNRAGQSVANVGLSIDNTGFGTSVTLHRLDNISVNNCKGTGIYVGPNSRAVYGTRLQARFNDEHGIWLANADSQFASLEASQSGLAGIRISGNALRITGANSWYSGRGSTTDAQPGFWFDLARDIMCLNMYSQENSGNGYSFVGTALTPCNELSLDNCESNSDGAVTGNHCFFLFRCNNSKFDVRGTKTTGLIGTPNSVVFNGGNSTGNDVTVRNTVSGTWALGGDWTGNRLVIAHRPHVTATAYAASYTPFPETTETAKITLTGNITINAPTIRSGAVLPGLPLAFVFVQDATGGRAVTFNAAYRVNWSPVTTPNTINRIEFKHDGTSWVQVAAAVGL